MEDQEMEESAYKTLQNCKASAENLVAEMLSLKQQGLPRSHLRELITQMFLNFITLTQANRSILLEEEQVRRETENEKESIDLSSIQLQNLMYEKSQCVKAIKSCKDFKSKYSDIELVTEEEFLRDAPDSIKHSVLSNDNAHDLMLKRLNFELFQRKELCKLHNKMEREKKTLLDAIASRKKFLSSLPSQFKSLKKASLPVQSQLGVQETRKLKHKSSAELLPTPLYVIYSQLLAQKEAFGESIDLEIVGSLKDAQTLARHQAHKDTGVSASLDVTKLKDEAPDDIEDVQGQRKRPRMDKGKEGLSPSDVLQVHPLKINLHLYDDEASDLELAKLVILTFEYLVKLNIVCVGIEASDEGPNDNDILCNLFPDDNGLELPHQSAKLIVGDAIGFIGDRTSRPYKWAQRLAGINFSPELSPLLLAGHETSDNSEAAKAEDVRSGNSLSYQKNRVQTILHSIRLQRKAQLAHL